MGIGGISIGPLLLILVIVILLFGTKKLKNLGGDLGGALRDFKKSLSGDTKEDVTNEPETAGTVSSDSAKVAHKTDEVDK